MGFEDFLKKAFNVGKVATSEPVISAAAKAGFLYPGNTINNAVESVYHAYSHPDDYELATESKTNNAVKNFPKPIKSVTDFVTAATDRTLSIPAEAYTKQLTQAVQQRQQANTVANAMGANFKEPATKAGKQAFAKSGSPQAQALDTSRLNSNDYISAIQGSTNLGLSVALPAEVYTSAVNSANALADYMTANTESAVLTPEDLASRAQDPTTSPAAQQYYQSLSDKGYSVRATSDVATRSPIRNAIMQAFGGNTADTVIFNGKVQLFRQLPDGTAIDATGEEIPDYDQTTALSSPESVSHGQITTELNTNPTESDAGTIPEQTGLKTASISQESAPEKNLAGTPAEPPKPPRKMQGESSDVPDSSYKEAPKTFAFTDPNPMEFSQLQAGVDSVKGVTQDIRDTYAGIKNAQQLRSSLLADSMDKDVKDPLAQQAMQLFTDVKGDLGLLEKAMEDPAIFGNPEWAPVIKKAMNLDPETSQALKAAQKFYAETGYVGQQYGFLSELRDSYVPRVYRTKSEPQIRTEVNTSGLKKTTAHAKPRTFNNVIEALQHGKSPVPIKLSDGVRIYGAEFGRILANNKLYQALEQYGLGITVATDERVPDDYSRVGMTNFAVPSWLKQGLRSITEPNLIADIGGITKTSQMQAVIKTIDLSFSAFHHLTMLMQTAYEGKFGVDFLLNWKTTMMANKDFSNMAIDFVEHNGMVTNRDSYKDVLDHIGGNKTFFNKFPATRALINLSKANSKFLFGTLQTYLKVIDYSVQAQKWIAAHPDASPDAIVRAKRGFANATNAAFGGLNLESLGITPSQVQVMRWFMLAPDWVMSNVKQFQYAGTDYGKSSQGNGRAGSRSRSNIITALAGGYLLTLGLNQIFSGHAPWKNPKGHQFDVQIPAGKHTVYMSLFRGGVGDLVKIYEYIQEDGVAGGIARYTQSKLAPVPRTFMALAGNIDYYGRQIYKPTDSWLQKTEKGLSYTATQGIGAVPFGISGMVDLYQQAEAQKAQGNPSVWDQIKNMKTADYINFVLTGTGLARPGVSQEEGTYKDDVAIQQDEHASQEAKILPLYQEAQSLIKQGNVAGAQAITQNMSPQDYKIYKDIKAAQSSANTKQEEQDMYQTYLQVQGLVQNGNTAEAQSITAGMTSDQYKTYKKLKAEFGGT